MIGMKNRPDLPTTKRTCAWIAFPLNPTPRAYLFMADRGGHPYLQRISPPFTTVSRRGGCPRHSLQNSSWFPCRSLRISLPLVCFQNFHHTTKLPKLNFFSPIDQTSSNLKSHKSSLLTTMEEPKKRSAESKEQPRKLRRTESEPAGRTGMGNEIRTRTEEDEHGRPLKS